MGFPIVVRWHLYIESAPWALDARRLAHSFIELMGHRSDHPRSHDWHYSTGTLSFSQFTVTHLQMRCQ